MYFGLQQPFVYPPPQAFLGEEIRSPLKTPAGEAAVCGEECCVTTLKMAV